MVVSIRDSRGTIDPRELGRMFSAPRWLHDLGVLAWLLVGVGLVFFGVIWLLGETETIVLPVVTGTIVAAVAGPVVSALARHRAHELPAQRSSCSAC
jgi:predicted PurR-regulated permease PerM